METDEKRRYKIILYIAIILIFLVLETLIFNIISTSSRIRTSIIFTISLH